MRNYSLKTRASLRRNSHKKVLVRIILGVIAAVFVLWIFGAMISATAHYVVTPVYKVKTWFLESSASIPQYFRSRNELLRELQELRSNIAGFSSINARNKLLLSENEELRSLLSSDETPRIAAGIIARPPYTPYDLIFIDRGSKDGIQKGAYVFSNDSYVIGYVTNAFRNSALVKLFSSPNIEFPVYIIGPDIYTHAVGQGGGVIEITVPQGIQLNREDVVILPTATEALVGTIASIDSVPSEPKQRAYVLFKTSLQEMQYVSVSNRVIEEISFEQASNIVDNTIESLLTIDIPEDLLLVSPATSSATSTEAGENDNEEGP